ncbi:hypothetical protein SAY87_025605 [Trapa incisa]|uniref:C3H1-type domain-containing protein n=1 Tax=Trapa incisa TaxID=236973 RepID=A0AAN7GTN1_9MYRT|nr:hypothetical protein SAY87_025605 [Trapa incisa]
MDVDGNKRVFQRLGAPSTANPGDPSKQKVCYHWRAGKCTRYQCPFLHRELPPPTSNEGPGKRFAEHSGSQFYRKGSNKFNGGSNTWGRVHGTNNMPAAKKSEKLCNFWLQGKCAYGEGCRFLHSWSVGDSFSLLTQLESHQKVVTGIAFPSGSDKLYTGSKDESVRMWDCQSGQCTCVVNLGGEVGCMISEGPWLFVGLPNLVKAWNTQTSADLSLSGPVGQVYALVVGNSMLFAGTQDGSILAWKYNEATNNFDPAASLTGHSVAVISLVVGAKRLYSGSMDNTIRVWNLENLQCMQILTDHTSIVMSVLCWDQFLLSCSLDKTIKVWAGTESGNLEVTYTHTEDHGVLFLCGVHDLAGKPVLLCACNDNSVRVYDLPSFSERGKIFAKQEVRAIQPGPGGIFFTGDGTGQVRVWKWAESSVQQ